MIEVHGHPPEEALTHPLTLAPPLGLYLYVGFSELGVHQSHLWLPFQPCSHLYFHVCVSTW